MLQHTPREVTVAPPLLVMFPPDTAVVSVMEDTVVVLNVANSTGVVAVKLNSLP